MDARLVPIQELCILSGRETFVVRDILATMQTPEKKRELDAMIREACRPDVIGRWTR